MSESWSADEVETLKSLFSEGWTLERIGRKVGRSGAAVSGKLKRLGLMGQDGAEVIRVWTGMSKAQREVQRAKSRATVQAKIKTGLPTLMTWGGNPKPVERYVDRLPRNRRPFDPAKMVTTLELEPHHCRYPIGDPRSQSFRYCGETAIPGRSYCPDCNRVVTVPADDAATGVNFASDGETRDGTGKATHETQAPAGEAPTLELEEA